MLLKLRHILAASLISAMVLSSSQTAVAQQEGGNIDVAAAASYDPIVATLDSLVSLNYIQRLNFASVASQQNNNFQPYEVPAYDDDIYRKRMEKIQTPIPMTFNSQVKEYIDLYALRKRALTERVMGLANLYFPLYEQVFDQQGLPLEFKYLSIVESALNPMAVSRVGATGLWQFMLATGKLYNLKVNSMIDERRDPVKSTMAAAQYFKDMYAIYNDWLLVVAAYNCGAGNVNRAIARSGGKKTFWEISPYLPKETRGYVPAFIAVTYLMNYSAEHNLTAIPPVISYFEADTVMVDQKLKLSDVADAINVPVELLSYLNPVYKRGVIPESDEPMVLRLPSSKINTYLANVDNIYRPDESNAYALLTSDDGSFNDPATYADQLVKKLHRVRSGEHLQGIANRYSCTVQELKRWNKLKSTRLVAGQRLTVYVTAKKKSDPKLAVRPLPAPTPVSSSKVSDTTAAVADTQAVTASAQTASEPRNEKSSADQKFVYHVVQPGDTLWKIAQRYDGLSVDEIKQINQLRSNEIKVGTRLKVAVGS